MANWYDQLTQLEMDSYRSSGGVDPALEGKVTKAVADSGTALTRLGGVTAHEIYVKEAPGSTLYQKLQGALNLDIGKRHKIVVAPPEEIILESTLKIPSHTTLVLYGTRLKLADGVNDRILTNSDFVNGNEHIYIVGYGDAVLDGNGSKQTTPAAPAYKNIGVHFYKVKNSSVRDVTVASTKKWAFVPEAVEHLRLSNINFDLEGNVNQDGVHIIGPSTDVIVNGMRGTFGDDSCVVNARPSTGGTGEFQGFGTGGSITGVIFDNVHIKGLPASDGDGHTGMLRTSAGGSNIIKGVTLSNGIGEGIISVARLGGNDVTTTESVSGITIENVEVLSGFKSGVGQGIIVMRDVGQLTIRNVTPAKVGTMTLIDNYPTGWSPSNIDGLIIEGCSVKADSPNTVNDYVIKLKGGTVKNAKIDVMADGAIKNSVGFSGILLRDVNLKNVEFNLILNNMISIIKTEGTTVMDNVRLNYNASNITGNAFDLAVSNGLTVKGNLDTKLYKLTGGRFMYLERFDSVINGTLRYYNSGQNAAGVMLRNAVAELRTGKTLVVEAEGTVYAGSGITWFAREVPETIAVSTVFQGYTLYFGGTTVKLNRGDVNGMGTTIATIDKTLDYAKLHKLRITHTDLGVITAFVDGEQILQVTDTTATSGFFCIHTQVLGTVELSRLEFTYI